MKEISVLKEWLNESRDIVFLGGAGVSTESGIPDFRSAEGLYSENIKQQYPPEEVLSYSFFLSQPEYFFEFYKAKMLFPDALPNMAHKKLAELEKQGKLKAVITQNIDNLHQKAGSNNVLELHGSVYRNYCLECGKKYHLDFMIASEGIPRCSCGGVVRPDVVMYEESLNQQILRDALTAISSAEMLIVGGTSLNVYPAAGLVNYYHGDKLVLINRSQTAFDRVANLIVSQNIGEVLEKAI